MPSNQKPKTIRTGRKPKWPELDDFLAMSESGDWLEIQRETGVRLKTPLIDRVRLRVGKLRRAGHGRSCSLRRCENGSVLVTRVSD